MKSGSYFLIFIVFYLVFPSNNCEGQRLWLNSNIKIGSTDSSNLNLIQSSCINFPLGGTSIFYRPNQSDTIKFNFKSEMGTKFRPILFGPFNSFKHFRNSRASKMDDYLIHCGTDYSTADTIDLEVIKDGFYYFVFETNENNYDFSDILSLNVIQGLDAFYSPDKYNSDYYYPTNLLPGVPLCSKKDKWFNYQYSGGFPTFFSCGTNENSLWYSIIPQKDTINISLKIYDCINDTGCEILVFNPELDEVSSCLSTNGNNPDTSVLNLIVTNLEVHQWYFIMIDGFAGDICEYELFIDGNVTERIVDDRISTSLDTGNIEFGDTVWYFIENLWEDGISCNWEVFGDFELLTPIIRTDSIQVKWGCSEAGIVKAIFTDFCELESDTFILKHSIRNGISTTTTLPIQMICEEEFPITIDGILFQEPGVFDSIFLSSTGCDSVVVYTVESFERSPFEIADTICRNQTYILPDGNEVDSAGLYEVILNNASSNGCDSIIQVQLRVLPNLQSFQTIESCEGESILLSNGLEITQSGTYSVVLPSSGGCDSIIQYDVTFHSNYEMRDSFKICNGDSYLWQGQLLDTPGNYISNLQTENGCDSIQRLNLSTYLEPAILDTIIIPDNGSENGSVILQISGDTSNYTYAWNNGANTMNLSDVPFGTYSLTVGYGDGCFAEFTFEVDRVSSVDGVLSDKGILVYPNPAGDYLNVEIKKAQSNIDKIEVLSASGNLLLYQRIYSKETQVDLQGFASGNYYLRLFGKDDVVLVLRFVKG